MAFRLQGLKGCFAEARLLAGLVGFGAVLCVVVLGLGLRASRRSMQRLMEMEQALAQYSGGDMDARLPVIAQDQFDRVSGQMNRNLDRLSRLVGGYHTTASAIAHDLKTPLSHVQIALHEAADAAESGQNALPELEEALRAAKHDPSVSPLCYGAPVSDLGQGC